ncbi:MAG: ATP-binding protein [Limisphaerales bacterium]
MNLVSHEFPHTLERDRFRRRHLENYFDRLKPEQRAGHLQDIRHCAGQMTSLMEEVLLLGKVDAGKMTLKSEPLDLAGFCRRLVDEQLSATSRKCPVLVELKQIADEALGDEGLLRHIFANLLSNAVKYSTAGSPVRFTVKREGETAVFTLRDHGIGIPMEDQPRLFEAFHRGRNVGEIPGTGLGLVIVKRCVDLHGGEIAVESGPRLGTTVTVRFETVCRNHPRVCEKNKTNQSPMNKILIIEDQPQMRKNLVIILEMEGFQVVAAENGRRGVELALNEPPELVLCDVMMPELDGYGVLAALRAEAATATIPFIFLTAKGDKLELRKGMNLGADDYLTKPVSRDDLLAAIKTGWRGVRRTPVKSNQPSRTAASIRTSLPPNRC